MRITFNSSYREPLADLERAAERMAVYQRQVSSGKRVHRPSDDPAAAAGAIGERAELAAIDRYAEAADSAEARLRAADAVLSDLIMQLTNAKVAAQSGRGSVVTPAQREAAAGALEAVAEAILADIRVSVAGSYLFSGTASTTPPYAKTGATISAYQGNGSRMAVDLDRNESLYVSFDARDVVAPGGNDVFAILEALAAAVRAGDDTAIQAGLDGLDEVFQAATKVQSEVGNSFRMIESQRDRLNVLGLASKTRLSKLEDANMATAASGLASSETLYRAALAAIGSTARLSLLDYLK